MVPVIDIYACMTYPTIDELNAINLSHLQPFVDARDEVEFMKPAGQQHYRLLAWFSTKYNGANIFDIGTWHGSSAIALSYSSNNVVYSYDIAAQRSNTKTPFNVAFQIQDLLELERYAKTDLGDMSSIDKERYFPDMRTYRYLQYSPLVLIDVHNVETGNHDGVLEQQFYDLLVLVGFRGVAIFDDIHLTPETRKFWDGVTLEKMDVTHLGHGAWNAGTGIIFFDSQETKFPKWKKLESMNLGEIDANGRPKNWCD